MNPRHLSLDYRRAFAEDAAHQRDVIEKHWPARVRLGELEADQAQAEFQAWVAIARWTAGVPIGFDIGFAEMAHAAATALQRGEEACQAQPDNPRRIQRRDAVNAIYSLLCEHRDWLIDINAKLRADAARRQLEAEAA